MNQSNSPKIIPEKETREKIANRAFMIGGETARHDILAIYNKIDNALKNCTNESEKIAIAEMGVAELHNYFFCRGELVVNGKQIIPQAKDFVDNPEETPGKIIKL